MSDSKIEAHMQTLVSWVRFIIELMFYLGGAIWFWGQIL